MTPRLARKARGAPPAQLALFAPAQAPFDAFADAQLPEPEPADPDEAARAAARRMAGSLVLRAGAGTGKTHTLVDAMVHLVAGTTALRRPVHPARILVLTFSEKATAEVRERVRGRFLALAAEPRRDATLVAACARAGLEPPTAEEWRRAADEVAAAPISTFHGFAASVLRRHAASAGVDPAFAILVEDEAALLRRARLEETVLAALAEPEARELARELDFSRKEGFGGKGLIELLEDVAARLAEEGAAAESLLGGIDDEAAARAAWREAARDLLTAVDEAMVHLEGAKKMADRLAELRAAAPAARADLARGEPIDPLASDAIRRIAEACKGNLGTDERRQAKARVDGALAAMRTAWASVRAAPLAASFASLVARATAAYEEAKQLRGVLDFGDLVRRARDLLRDDAAARADERTRWDAILVDELQDTNDLQDALVELVRPEGAPLLAVGDPKQSIYEFRGADVAVFERVAARVAGGGGRAMALTGSHRAARPLTTFVNRLFARAMRGGAHAFEIRFDADTDALDAKRGGDGVHVELLEGDRADAALVAGRIRELVDGAAPLVVDKGASSPRTPRWGDVSILLRRFTHLDAYLAALRAASIPHYVVNGRGFYEAQEVRDLSHALALLDDPDDALALLGVLRSPLVGLSDGALVALADLSPPKPSGAPGALGMRALLAAGFAPPPALDAGEAARLMQFLNVYRRLRRHGDRIGAAGTLRALVEETDLRAVLATTWYGEQRVANLERLLWLAVRHDDEGRGDRRAFARRLGAQVQRERSLAAPAQVLGEKEDVVRVMTIHQSKGLEFPVVFVPECGARERENVANLVFDRAVGLGLRVRGADDRRVASRQAEAAAEVARARARAESMRLFYVATTRARDLLVLCGKGDRREGTWRGEVDEAAGEVEGLVRVVRVVKVDGNGPDHDHDRVVGGRDGDGNGDGNGEAVRRFLPVLGAPARGARRIVAPVTELADFDACARRYHLRHEVGLEEHETSGGGAALGEMDAIERGTLAHRLLERIDFAAWRERGAAALDEVLAEEGLAAEREVGEVRDQVAAFLAGAFGRALVARGDEEIRREVPFALALGGGETPRLLLKGQIDLVLLDGADGVTVLDYKLARTSDKRDYRFQLLAYAAAARALFARRPRAGLVFLGDREPAPRFLDVSDEDLDAFLARLEAITADMAEARRVERWDGRAVETCRRLRCGYVKRCHPEE